MNCSQKAGYNISSLPTPIPSREGSRGVGHLGVSIALAVAIYDNIKSGGDEDCMDVNKI